MIIFPAIDILGGVPVRLYKGEFSTAKRVAESALAAARAFESDGAEWIHMVDLDGSKEKKRVNSGVFLEVAEKTGLKVELGGGIRTMGDIEFYLENGISRVILGSAAIKDHALVENAVKKYGGKIAVGIDAKNGFAAAEGWLESSAYNYIDLAKKMEALGVSNIIYTDISKDGTLSGPNLKELAEINNSVSCSITASGGVTDLDDILALRDLKLYGAICGRSIYNATLSLRDAIGVCK
ncbi:MAG: 1-(5-phosphoribosyl)-5-[(5-phosphoribosylamino)methylideneamino]imidazole-4-carboxamide isomerase [Clostridiales bacterium]|nr:1-(5-phosphoribosyl)-5-[(5-phosphoribosylamino)methylideneamino]imidazole-4-carboxamide isomerase [Clostridiales bacterium]